MSVHSNVYKLLEVQLHIAALPHLILNHTLLQLHHNTAHISWRVEYLGGCKDIFGSNRCNFKETNKFFMNFRVINISNTNNNLFCVGSIWCFIQKKTCLKLRRNFLKAMTYMISFCISPEVYLSVFYITH